MSICENVFFEIQVRFFGSDELEKNCWVVQKKVSLSDGEKVVAKLACGTNGVNVPSWHDQG